MDAGKGLNRQLPPPPQEQEQIADILESDIITIALNAENQLMLNGEMVSLQRLQKEVREFAAVNPKHRVIAIKVASTATYDAYFQLQNAIVAAYKPLKYPPRISEVVEEEGGEP